MPKYEVDLIRTMEVVIRGVEAENWQDATALAEELAKRLTVSVNYVGSQINFEVEQDGEWRAGIGRQVS